MNLDEQRFILRPRGKPRGQVKCINFLATAAVVAMLVAAGKTVVMHPLDPSRGYVMPADQLSPLEWTELNQSKHWIYLSTVVFLTTASSSPYTSDATWNNSSNTVECVGSGGSGGLNRGDGKGRCAGGGAGAYSAITNFSFATPGTTTAQFSVGTGGAGQSKNTNGVLNGNDGAATWFNNATDPGNGADNSKCSAAGGAKGTAGSSADATGGAGGATTASWGTTKNAGGRGGNASTTDLCAAGGGGAGGGAGAGNQGVDVSTGTASNGGTGNANTGGGGTAGSGANGPGAQTATAGGAGTNFDASHGSGGGGGAARSSSGTGTSTAGAGGAYGGGSGAVAIAGNGTAVTLAGGDGLIVLTWTPAAGAVTIIRGPIPGGLIFLP